MRWVGSLPPEPLALASADSRVAPPDEKLLELGRVSLGGELIPLTDFSVSFATGAGDPLTGGNLAIRLRVSESQFGQVRFADFDNVRLDGTALTRPPIAPEPASMLLLALAGGYAAIRRRTHRRQ
jgi:hypothetical protein